MAIEPPKEITMNTTQPKAAKSLSPDALASFTDQEFADGACTWLYMRAGKDWSSSTDTLRVGEICEALCITTHVSPLVREGPFGRWHDVSVGSIIFREDKSDARWRRMVISEAAAGRGAKTSALMGALLALTALDALGAGRLSLARSSSIGDLAGNALACRQYGRKLSLQATGSTPHYWSAVMREAEAASRKLRPRAWRQADRAHARLTRAMRNDTVGAFLDAALKRGDATHPIEAGSEADSSPIAPAIAAE